MHSLKMENHQIQILNEHALFEKKKNMDLFHRVAITLAIN